MAGVPSTRGGLDDDLPEDARRVALLLLATTALASPEARAAGVTAASIEYDFVARPGGLPADFDAPAGASLRFLAIKAIDGFRVDAALWQPAGKAPASTTLVVTVHGSGGSFHGNPQGFLSRGLMAKGFGVLGINTRPSGDKVNTDNFFDIRRDIEAAVYAARALGYRTLVLHGHSLGNIQVQFHAATDWTPDVKAVVLTAMFANLPWKSRHLLVQDEANWRQLGQVAFDSLRGGTLDAVLPVRMGWITGVKVPLTGQHFLTYRSEASSVADGTYWIRRVTRPILMVRDAGDAIIEPFEPYMLLSAATGEGSLVPSVKLVVLPNPRGRSAAAHGFADNQQALVDTVAGWLTEQRL
jgi:hypothetical protein